MIKNDDFAKWTNEMIAEDMENGQLNNVLRICETHFDLWTKELFPLLQSQGKSCYRAVVAILHKGGCHNANEDMVRSYFAYIRKKRGIKKSAGRAPHAATGSFPHITTPVVASPLPGAAPIVPPLVAPVALQPPMKAPTPGEEAYPHVYAKASLTPPVDYEDYGRDLESLQEQSRTGWLEWSGFDEGHWLGFLTKIERYNKTYDPKWTVKGNQVNFWKYLEVKDDIDMFKVLVKKVVEKRRI